MIMGYNTMTLGQCQRQYDLLTKVVCDGDHGECTLSVDYELITRECDADDTD